MAGKKTGPRKVVMGQEHKDKIANSNILSRLIGHAEGDIEMSQSQVTAGLALLKKVMPDLSATTVSGDKGNPVHVKVTIGGDA